LRVLRLFAAISCFAPPVFAVPLSDGSFYTAAEAANDEKEQHVADCCRCVASGKGQRNPCKIRLVAVLPIFRTCISILRVLRLFAAISCFAFPFFG
jgi:hypothetical protein